ncbi:hypothetical protein RND71_018593 [Anisodus tanguticus]|uniref:HTH myb-type domain-containing protein n=1 Tax=Anisodus tanguticus TaxID=243964 RepID=A0AAE1VC77_9SOLA|nr:hypothetical protein RND71_018593 [Anisodus tanguticus]
MEQEDFITAANNGSSPSVDTIKSSSGFQVGSTSGTKSNKQKMKKVEWTPELHNKFVEAVEQLGVDQAVPSRILKFMRVEGLTRQNIASHLQLHADVWGYPVMPTSYPQ